MARRLTRDTKTPILGGVAAGIANYFDLDPVLARIVFIALVFLNGFGLVAYIVGWIIIPREDRIADAAGAADAAGHGGAAAHAGGASHAGGADQAGAAAHGGAASPVDRIVETVREAGDRLADEFQRMPPGAGRGRVMAGSILIVLGVLFMLDQFPWWHWPQWARFLNLWPLILIAVGGAILIEAARGRGRKTP